MPAATVHTTKRIDVPFMVVFRDPSRREKSGRAKRVVKWFVDRAQADEHAKDLNERIHTDGTVGVAFDAVVRADAIAARRVLDLAGHALTLTELARAYAAHFTPSRAARLPIAEAIEDFLEHKRSGENRTARAVDNLSTRIYRWSEAAKLAWVGDITREKIEPLRSRPDVSPQTKKNDMNAVSSFCSWLTDQRLIEHHPLRGLSRPTVPRRSPPILTVDECAALLREAWAESPEAMAGMAVLIFTGARPSELAETRLFYGRSPAARIEGGKLRGRANRLVPLSATAVAWLKAAGSPPQVKELYREQRERVAKAAGVAWKGDICRHTFISNRLVLLKDAAAVAREAGTSETIIFRHYHRLVTPAQAKAWAGLRPKNRDGQMHKG